MLESVDVGYWDKMFQILTTQLISVNNTSTPQQYFNTSTILQHDNITSTCQQYFNRSSILQHDNKPVRWDSSSERNGLKGVLVVEDL